MIKQELLTALLELTTHLQFKGLELIENNSYTKVDDFMEDLFNDQELEQKEIKKVGIFGMVDKDRTMQEIGENQALMIFGERDE